ncbi:DUF2225 domain-containing protein [Clostridium sp. 19966]|uniref:DUF2225 domain-containing protein n=1 Tax=Clostridium sp. 19966 TaxID=2768166 RepID=UPI0028DFFD30|nr:DUF2225 domain-containing protein [Clostridium sp. 19966]MDT8719025.1 DUF2225 domain-containing protein [Clostridium sp. 19966]
MSLEDNKRQIFSGIEHLGFDNVKEVNLYKEKEEIKKEIKIDETAKDLSLLYDKELICPVCGHRFKAKCVKINSYRVEGKESDFHILYSRINPYFYDVWICDSCGYAAIKKDFLAIREYQLNKVKENVTKKWRGRTYPKIYDLDIAIERYKLSLFNYMVIESKSSSKAMNCLKLSWMYRLKNDVENENLFLKQALDGLNNAYYNEDFPIYGMDRFTTMYLIGELYRRLENYDDATLWFSNVVTGKGSSPKLKEMTRAQRDLIKKEVEQPQEEEAVNNESKKGGIFKFFLRK